MVISISNSKLLKFNIAVAYVQALMAKKSFMTFFETVVDTEMMPPPTKMKRREEHAHAAADL
jgi:hypothetical protein